MFVRLLAIVSLLAAFAVGVSERVLVDDDGGVEVVTLLGSVSLPGAAEAARLADAAEAQAAEAGEDGPSFSVVWTQVRLWASAQTAALLSKAASVLNPSAFEKWLMAGVFLIIGLALFSIAGRRVKRMMQEAAGSSSTDVALYDPDQAEHVRRRITDRGRRPIVFGVATCLVFFGGLVVWGATAPIESAALGQGVVQVESNRLTLDHPDGGTVRALLVREGDAVVAGQVLLTLDTNELESELAVFRLRRDALFARRARLVAEQTGAEAIAFPEDLLARGETDSDVADIIDSQIALFEANRAAQEGEIRLRRRRLGQLTERITGLRAQIDSFIAQIAIIDEELRDLEILFEQGLTSQERVLARRRDRLNLEGRVGALEADIAQTEAQMSEIELTIVQLERDRAAQIADDMRATFSELAELSPRISSLETQLARTELRAPASGAVFGLTKFTVGGVIRAGEPILEVVPAESRLIVQVRINPTDRDVIEPGQIARVRLTPFSPRELEPIEGVLERVSADAVQSETNEPPHYLGVIALSPEALAEQDVALQPGMPAEVILPLGTRTPIQYLIEPLIRNWDRAFKEE